MNMITTAVSSILLLYGAYAHSAGWSSGTVQKVSVMYGNGCVTLSNGDLIVLDLESAAGRAEMSIALSALTANHSVAVYQTDAALVGGCNTGNTIKPHTMFRIIK